MCGKQVSKFALAQEILPGGETDRLHRWGCQRYSNLFNTRQLYGRGRCAPLIAAIDNERVIQPANLGAVFTDPPYFGNVQYGELMDFRHVCLRAVLGEGAAAWRATGVYLSPQ